MPLSLLKKLNPLLQLAYYFSLFMISLGIALVGSMFVVMLVDGDSFAEVQKAFENGDISDSVLAKEWINFITQIINFLLPALLFIWIFGRRSVNSFWFKKPSRGIYLIPLLVLACSPLIEWTGMLNDWLIPEGGWIESWARPMEDEARNATEQALSMPGYGELLRNLFFIAIIPAICEEIAFRGIIQSLIAKSSGNIHVGIWAGALLFSLIHFQFYGLIPRMLLGGFFGYLLIWTGSIWAPILAHFTNNALVVCTNYFYQHAEDVDYSAFEQFSIQTWPAIVAVIFFTGLCFVLLKRSRWKSIKPSYLWYDTSPRHEIHPTEN